jgi:hypothetical protein
VPTLVAFCKNNLALGDRVFNRYPATVPAGLFAVISDEMETPTPTYDGDTVRAQVTVHLYQPQLADGSPPARTELDAAFNTLCNTAPSVVDRDGLTGAVIDLDRVMAIRPQADDTGKGNYAACRFRAILTRP